MGCNEMGYNELYIPIFLIIIIKFFFFLISYIKLRFKLQFQLQKIYLEIISLLLLKI